MARIKTTYTCEICGAEMVDVTIEHKCPFCRIKLCTAHVNNEYCPTHDRILTHDEKRRVYESYKLWRAHSSAWCVAHVALSIFASIWFLSVKDPGMSSLDGKLFILFLMICIVTPFSAGIWAAFYYSKMHLYERQVRRVQFRLDATPQS